VVLFLENFFANLIIYLVVYCPLILFLLILCLPSQFTNKIKIISLFGTIFIFILSIYILLLYSYSISVCDYSWFEFKYYSEIIVHLFNIKYILGIDGISLLLIVLTTLLIPICLLVNITVINYRFKEYVLILIFLEILLLNTFSVLNLLFFYIFFESVLIPMFLIIGIWGSRQRKIHAAYQFFLYTFFGSIFMLVSILIIYLHTGSINYEVLLLENFDIIYQKFLWLAIFFSFAIKVPMVPVHIWLPEAHVEAPTAGSVLLAGILLKLGSYGILRFLIPLFPLGTNYFLPFIYLFCIIAIIYGSLTTLRQIDLKKIIAYSSVVHMNFALIGIFSLNIEGIQGSIFLMLSHGIVSGALFLCIGCLYDRYHTRILTYFNGLVITMPIFSIYFLIFTLANIAFPGTSSFIGEFLIFLGIFKENGIIGFLSSFGIILSATYSIWLFNRVMFQNISLKYFNYFRDLKKTERILFYPLIFLVFFMGIYPKFFLDITYVSVLKILIFI
jgi:proton-translocating NADH-quinone oxidoreductase chain M